MCLVFLDSGRTVFNPSWVRSNFIHCFIVVQLVKGAHGQPLYKVAVTKRSTVPSFYPELKHMGVFAHSTMLQQFLLTKMVNGERASYHAPKFLKLTVSVCVGGGGSKTLCGHNLMSVGPISVV